MNERPFLFGFDGSDSSIGAFTRLSAIAVNEGNGEIFAINATGSVAGPTGYGSAPNQVDDERVVCRFNSAGEAQNFTAGSSAGKSCLDGKETPGGAFGVEGIFQAGAFRVDVAIDNSAVNPGRIYVSEVNGPIHAFNPNGSYLWTLDRTEANPCGITVDREGHLLVGNGSLAAPPAAREKVLVFANSGSPPVQIDEISMTKGSKLPCRLAIDESGKNLYVASFSTTEVDRYREEVYDSTLPTIEEVFDITVDQSKEGGHVFTVAASRFREFEPCPIIKCPIKETSGSPFGRDLIGDGTGVADNPGLDRVYVSDSASNSIKVFGPVTSGTAPDVTCGASTGVGLHAFTANCTINPLSLPHEYHFEWKEGTGSSWGKAESSATQSIVPSDSSSHAVSLEITKYKGKSIRSNTAYQVRLVGTNTENSLSAYSNADSLKTLVPPPAEIGGCSTSAMTTESAHVTCTVDPQEEETEWMILTKTLPGASVAKCQEFSDGEFEVAKEGIVEAEEPATVLVGADLAGLLPAQSYCLRAITANSGGGDREDLTFNTLPAPPSGASTAFAAPRTDITARINGRLNPNGEAAITGGVSYRFEVSTDGINWTQRPILSTSIDAREQIIVADELTGLEPATTYHYRFGLVESAGGGALDLGEERTFTTRSAAEAEEIQSSSCPNEDVRANQHATHLGSCRGIELVTPPDKGNQNVFSEVPPVGALPVSANGNEVLWRVAGGAPGGPSGTLSAFVASRTASGWISESVIPPAEEQWGGGDLSYQLNAITPGFTAFVFGVRVSTALDTPPPPTVVRVREGVQDVLKEYTGQPVTSNWEKTLDLSDDGAHVLFINAESGQLEDIGDARVGPPPNDGEVVSLMPGGTPSECGLDPFDGLSFGRPVHPGYHWIATTDASRVYFRVQPDGNCGGSRGLYVRNREKGVTTLIDAANPAFMRASPDGRKAYFLTASSLDPADSNSHPDVYLWDEAAGGSACLTCVVADAGVANTIFDTALISDDFSRLYFLSENQLVEGLGVEGDLNLYALQAGQLRFVATVGGPVLESGVRRPYLSANGNVLLFRASASPALTADETADECTSPRTEGLGACSELYRYVFSEESLECLSCDRAGTTTNSFGSPYVGEGFDFRLSDDGSTAAFITSEALLESDVNQDTDVYEWRAGRVQLISDGVSSFQEGTSAPRVIGLDGDGSDIVFALVPPGGSITGFERDGVPSLYDARVGGGFEPPPPAPDCFAGDSCQGPLQPPPGVQQPASGAFHGRGNLKGASSRCGKGKVRRKGRCVKRNGKHKKRSHKVRAMGAKQGGKR